MGEGKLLCFGWQRKVGYKNLDTKMKISTYKIFEGRI